MQISQLIPEKPASYFQHLYKPRKHI